MPQEDHTQPRPMTEAPTEQSTLATRLLSAFLMGPIAIGAAYFGGAWFAALIAFSFVLMCFEWSRMVEGKEFGRGYYVLTIAGVLALAFAALGKFPYAYSVAAIGGVAALFLRSEKRLAGRWVALGSLYLLMPCIALLWLRNNNFAGRELLFMLFAIVWATDSGAFLIGRYFGGPKLSPALSPAKTWSGAIGGVAAGGLASLVASEMILGQGEAVFYWLVGACLGLMSILGDLVESAFKRVFGVKDISGFIPGHGGVLDRLDGMIFACVAMTATLYAHILYNSLQ